MAVLPRMKARAKAKRGQPRTIQPSKRWEIAKVAAIILAGLLPYLPALRGGFVWDDEPLITANPLLQTPSGLAEIWSGSRTADYFPVTNTVFWIEHHLFGDNATGWTGLVCGLFQATGGKPTTSRHVRRRSARSCRRAIAGVR